MNYQIDGKLMEDTRYKILLIEDNKLDQMAFEQFLKNEKLLYDCTIAASVSEAQSILASEQFDTIVADYSLGDGTALDILDSVKDIPIIVVTGVGDEEVATKAWRGGAYDYLTKVSEQNYLKAIPKIIKNAIERKKLEEALDRKQKNLETIGGMLPKIALHNLANLTSPSVSFRASKYPTIMLPSSHMRRRNMMSRNQKAWSW